MHTITGSIIKKPTYGKPQTHHASAAHTQ